jgi:UDP-N-acetylmuramoyl-tripeptide--D-alanyl-D-alanine ligase
MKFLVGEVAAALGVKRDAPAGKSDEKITGWSIDSRTIRPGDVFFALRGPNHDGHAYVADVLRRGAAAAVVEHSFASEGVEAGGEILRVEDTLSALQNVAGWARKRWNGEVVGVTGSAGKTTTKNVIAEMLAVGRRTAKNEGNLNNHIGLPLSLLRLDETAEVAVLEMGMNHAGEIRTLANIAGPNTGVVTNVGYAHIENFESIEGIASAKQELVESLGENGTAVLNADDPRVAAMARVHPGKMILYGQSADANIRGEEVEFTANGSRFRVRSTKFETQLTGRHNVLNVLAGIAVGGVYGIEPQRLVEPVARLVPEKMRGQRFEHQGITIFDDCYNSNPDAVRAMLDVLRDTPAKRRIAVLGEMLELGRWAEPLHRDVGDYASRCGIDVLVGIRGAACFILDAAIRAGLRASAAFFFEGPDEAGRFLRTIAQPGDAILFKGSRGVHVEQALRQFSAPEDHAGSPIPTNGTGGQH